MAVSIFPRLRFFPLMLYKVLTGSAVSQSNFFLPVNFRSYLTRAGGEQVLIWLAFTYLLLSFGRRYFASVSKPLKAVIRALFRGKASPTKQKRNQITLWKRIKEKQEAVHKGLYLSRESNNSPTHTSTSQQDFWTHIPATSTPKDWWELKMTWERKNNVAQVSTVLERNAYIAIALDCIF